MKGDDLDISLWKYIKQMLLFTSEWEDYVALRKSTFRSNSLNFVYYMVYIAYGVFGCGSLQVACWSLQATR